MKKNKPKILYIDDEVVNLRLFKYSYRRDFDIYIAESAKEGLDILKETEVDVIITDQRMPGMTGVELLEIINRMYPSIPPNRMIISGYSPDNVIEKAFNEFRLFRFVSKPWNYEKLKETIYQAIKTNYV